MDRERLRRLHVQANHRVDWNVRDRSRSKEENSFWFEVIRFIMLVILNLGDFFRPWQRLANKQERMFEVIRFITVVIFQIRETFPRPWDDGDRGLEVRAAEIPVPQASQNVLVFVSFERVFVTNGGSGTNFGGCTSKQTVVDDRASGEYGTLSKAG